MASRIRFCGGVLVVCGCLFIAACQKPTESLDAAPESAAEDDPATSSIEPGYSDQEWTGEPQTVAGAAYEPPVPGLDTLHYYTNRTPIMIRRPSSYSPSEISQVAVWWTDDNGFDWRRAGFFDPDHGSFALEVDGDGDYGVRFVGPGQRLASGTATVPERIYHVDMEAPEVKVSVEPAQSTYRPGQSVKISWINSDYHLLERSARVGVVTDFGERVGPPEELQGDLPDQGSINYTIPESMRGQALRVRVDALDRAGNLAIAFSDSLQVSDDESQSVADGEASGVASVEPRLFNELPDMNDGAIDDKQDVSEGVSATDVPTAVESGPVEVVADGRTTDAPISEQIAVLKEMIGSLGRDASKFAVSVLSGWSVAKPSLGPTEPQASEMQTVDSDNQDAPGIQTLIDATDSSDHDVGAVPEGPADEAGIVKAADAEGAQRGVSVEDSGEGLVAVSSDEDDSIEAGDTWDGTPECPPEEIGSSVEPADALFEKSAHGATAFDPTGGNGLLVPLPATLAQSPGSQRAGDAHPWRTLNESLGLDAVVWHLPKPRLDDALARMFEASFSAEEAEASSRDETKADESRVTEFPTLSDRGGNEP